MAGPSGAEQTRPPVRASDADREDAVAKLREGFAAGQLSQDTFVYRMEAALGAMDEGELAGLCADLPASRRIRMPDWRRLPSRIDLGSRARAVFTPVRDAVKALPSAVTSARPVGRRSRPPG